MIKFKYLIKTGPEQTQSIDFEADDIEHMKRKFEFFIEPLMRGRAVIFPVELPEGTAFLAIFPQILDKCTLAVATVLPEEPEENQK